MTIHLITKEEHENLLKIFHQYPNLTLQNKGYETLSKDKLTPDDLDKIKEVDALLKKAIVGFRSFTNFRLSRELQPEIRFQYNWGADDVSRPFEGVGYIWIDTLLNGFKKDDKSA